MKAINYARLAGLLEGTMTTIPSFVNTPGFKITDPKACLLYTSDAADE